MEGWDTLHPTQRYFLKSCWDTGEQEREGEGMGFGCEQGLGRRNKDDTDGKRQASGRDSGLGEIVEHGEGGPFGLN